MDGRQIAVDQPGAVELAEDREDAAGAVDILDMVLLGRGGDLAEVGDAAREAVDVGHREVHAGLVGDAEEVEDRVGRTAHRDVEGHRVLERLEGRDAAGQDRIVAVHVELLRHLDDPLPGALEELPAPGVGREDGAVAGEGEAEGLVQAVHAIRREHARAGAAGRTGGALHLEELGVRDRVVARGDHWIDQVELAAGAVAGAGGFARFHRTARDEDRRDVEPHRGEQHARRDLVAVRDADEGVGHVGLDHVLDAVGDQVPGRKRVEHPGVAHRDAVVDGDRVELDAPAPRRVDDFLPALADVVEMDVAGHELGETVGDRDDRLAEIGIGHAGGAPEGAGSGHVAAGGRRPASISLHGREDRSGFENWHETGPVQGRRV